MFHLSTEELLARDSRHTVREIEGQPHVWKEALHNYKERKIEINTFLSGITTKHPGKIRVLLTGAGSSQYAGGMIVDYLNAQNAEFMFEAVASTEIVSNPQTYLIDTPTVLVSFARSGNSPESIATVSLAEQCIKDVYKISFTCAPQGQLALLGAHDDKHLVLLQPPASNDQGFAMTSSLTSMMLSCLLVFDIMSQEQKEVIVEQLSTQAGDIMDRVGDIESVVNKPFKRLVYLGSGGLKTVAQEACLKCLELTAGQIPTLFDSPLGFRHGPKSFVDETTLVCVLMSSDAHTLKYDKDIVTEIRSDGIAQHVEEIQLNALGIPDSYLGLAYLVFAQIFATLTALKLGNGPDNPSPTGTVNRVVKGVTIHDYA